MRKLLLGTAVLLAACSQADAPIETDTAYQDVLQLALLDAKPGDVIKIPAGTHSLDQIGRAHV